MGAGIFTASCFGADFCDGFLLIESYFTVSSSDSLSDDDCLTWLGFCSGASEESDISLDSELSVEETEEDDTEVVDSALFVFLEAVVETDVTDSALSGFLDEVEETDVTDSVLFGFLDDVEETDVKDSVLLVLFEEVDDTEEIDSVFANFDFSFFSFTLLKNL